MLKAPLTALDPATDHGKPELIASAALFLMAKYAHDGSCARLASIIARHLQLLAEHPDAGPVLRGTCAQLLEQWDQIAVHEDVRQPGSDRPPGVVAPPSGAHLSGKLAAPRVPSALPNRLTTA